MHFFFMSTQDFSMIRITSHMINMMTDGLV